MTDKDLQELLTRFDSTDILDITSPASISLTEELWDFLGDSNTPISEILTQGIQSLKRGFYKISENPYYSTSLPIPTFSAQVLYLKRPSSRPIKYVANIGPMANICKSFNGQDPLIDEFETSSDRSEFKNSSKKILFEKIFHQNKIFEITESKFCDMPGYSDYKEVHWNFLN